MAVSRQAHGAACGDAGFGPQTRCHIPGQRGRCAQVCPVPAVPALPAVTAEGPSFLSAATLPALHEAQGEHGQLPARSPCHPLALRWHNSCLQMAPLQGKAAPDHQLPAAERREEEGEWEWGLQ